jgi:hypothetical protein
LHDQVPFADNSNSIVRKTMFLVKDEQYGSTYLVFTWEDPRKGGFRGEVIDGVTLDYDMEMVHAWVDGDERPDACTGQAPDNPKHFKVFRYNRDLLHEGYWPTPGIAVVFGSWNQYTRLHLIPPDPERTEDEPWYDYLDRLDEASRRRQRQAQSEERPAANSRDEVAAWVASRHLIADTSVNRVWYLPHGAPPDEIRLLEVNDRLTRTGDKLEPIDFGLDIGGARYRLLVADLATEELEEVKRNPARLPSGWSLDAATVWGRRG